MPDDKSQPTLIFPEGYFGRREAETPLKGWLGDVVVQSGDGTRYRVYFTDPIRLAQDLDGEAESGRPYFAEPGLIVLPEVTTEAMRAAVDALWHDGYFQTLNPCHPQTC